MESDVGGARGWDQAAGREGGRWVGQEDMSGKAVSLGVSERIIT